MDNKFNVNIDPAMAGGKYSNLVIITHSASEFVLDFAQNMPGMGTAQVASRIVMTPDHAKRLLAALNENVAKYENQFGEIRLANATFVVPGGPAAKA